MKIFITLLIVLSSLPVLAAFNAPLSIKQVGKDGMSFVFMRREGDAPLNGITIKDPQTKTILYEVRVVKCSDVSCLGQVVKNYSGLKLRADEEYVHSYNDVPIEVVIKDLPPLDEKLDPLAKPIEEVKPVAPEPKPEPKPIVAEKPAEKPKARERIKALPVAAPVVQESASKPRNNTIYLSYGSPIGPGFKVGYYRNLGPVLAGLNYANISSITNKVGIKGNLVSAAASYTVAKLSSSIDVNLVGELGMAKASLDFSGVNPDGPLVNETTYFMAGAGEGKLNFERFSFAAKMGFSKAGLKSTYDGTINKYANPYGSILVFLEIGAYYRF